MSIEKNTKNTLSHEDGGFTTLINETLSKIRHTGALGVYCYLASKPAGWEICKIELQHHFECGKAHIDTCFRYLKKIKAIEITSIRNSLGQITGWDTKLKRKISVQTVYVLQNTKNQHSGSKKTKLSTDTRIPVSHILDNPESGKSAIINKVVNKKSIIKKTNNKDPVSVFSDTCSVKNYIEMVVANRPDQEPLEDEIVDQGAFYCFTKNPDHSFDSVNKKINIFLKLVREGKWLIPQGWNGITFQSIREADELHEKNKRVPYEQERQSMQTIRQAATSGEGFKGFQEMFQSLKGKNNVKGNDNQTMQKQIVSIGN